MKEFLIMWVFTIGLGLSSCQMDREMNEGLTSETIE